MGDLRRVNIVCKYCGYRMPILYDTNAVSRGVYIRCKGAHCKKIIELVIKDGVQYKTPYKYDFLLGVYRSIFKRGS